MDIINPEKNRIQVTKMNNVDAMTKCESRFEKFNIKIDNDFYEHHQ